MSRAPLVIAHRGASARYVENTVAAFEGARALGADWVELDVHHGGDGSLVVHHDAELADGRRIRDLRRNELPAHVPVLAEALAACEGMGVNVEIKPHRSTEVVAPAVEAIRAWGGPVLVSSFDARIVEAVRADAPDLATALLVFEPVTDEVVARAAAAGHSALHPHDLTVDDGVVAACHDAGLAINVWTVDAPERMRRKEPVSGRPSSLK